MRRSRARPVRDDVGTHTVTLRATDGAGAFVEDAFVVTVENVNDAPTVTNALPDASTDEDAAFAFTVPTGTFDDADPDDALEISTSDLPTWLSFDASEATLSGTPGQGDVGIHTVTLRATDGDDAFVEDTMIVTVENVNDAPTVADALPDASADENSPFAFTIPAGTFEDVDPDDALTFSAPGLPAWLSFDAGTATLSGTPARDDVGAHTVRLRATDADDAFVENTMLVTVGLDETALALTVEIDPVTEDDTVNAAEALVDLPVTGTVTGEFAPGATVVIQIEGEGPGAAGAEPLSAEVDGIGRFTVTVPGARLAAAARLTAFATTAEVAGLTGTGAAEHEYATDLASPEPEIAVAVVTDDNTLNAAEVVTEVAVTGSASGDVLDGDVVTLTIGERTFAGAVGIDEGEARWTILVPGNVLAANTVIGASVATADAAGNPARAEATHEYLVDVDGPELAVALDPIADDDVVNAAEAGAGVTLSGVVTGDHVEGDAVTVTVGGSMFDAALDAGGRFEIPVDEAALVAADAVGATVTTADAAGNPGTATASRGLRGRRRGADGRRRGGPDRRRRHARRGRGRRSRDPDRPGDRRRHGR